MSGVMARQPAAARREDAAVQPRAAVRLDAREQQAAVRPAEVAQLGVQPAADPLVPPSKAASVFRQGPFLGSGPARPPAAARFAHAMRSLRVASRSEPWWQAARNEGWSWW